MSIDRIGVLEPHYPSNAGLTKIPTYGSNRRCKLCHQPIVKYKSGKYCFCHQGAGTAEKEERQQALTDASVRKNNYKRYARIKNQRILDSIGVM